MFVIDARNVNDALWGQLDLFEQHGVERSSRNGDVLVISTPVTTIYEATKERVLWSPIRDANPFFHLVEALWMLEGRNDLRTVEFFVRRMRDFSDDGKTLHGAYGKRWRTWFGFDQLDRVIKLLQRYPNSRRAMIQMWDPITDLNTEEDKKDLPCNTCIHVQLIIDRNGKETLELTIFCRSNDAIWGATGANAVHFSILQEYLASRLGKEVGKIYQISNNLHVYKNIFDNIMNHGYMHSDLGLEDGEFYRYNTTPDSIVEAPESFDNELSGFFSILDTALSNDDYDPTDFVNSVGMESWNNTIFNEVVTPMVASYIIFRRGKEHQDRYDAMLTILADAIGKRPNSDWLLAAFEWTGRRQLWHKGKQGEGEKEND